MNGKPVSTLGALVSQNVLRFRVLSVFVSFLAVFVVFSITTSGFLNAQNVKIVAFNAAILIIVASGEAFVVTTRNLDVSVGSIVGLAGYSVAKYAAANAGAGGELIVLGMAVGAALGLINGLIVAYGRVPSIVATLSTLSIFRGITYLLGRGVEVPSGALPRWMIYGADATVLGIPLVVIIAVAIVLILEYLLRNLALFRQIFAVGSNPTAAVSYGLRSERVVLMAYVISGLLAGLGGFLYASRVGTVTVNLGRNWEITVLAAVVIGGVSTLGGTGNLFGVLFGAMILSTIDNGLVLSGTPEFWRMFIQGSAIVGAITMDSVIDTRMRKAFVHGRNMGDSQ
jgi:rhamnose transport system permease protein